MRTGVLFATLAGLSQTGCLYIGEVNRAPTASLTVESVSNTLIKGAQIQLTATLSDPEDGSNLEPVWAVESLDFPNADGTCDYHINNSNDSQGHPSAVVSFFRTGNWQVTVFTKDRYGARSNTSSVMIQVTDAPPVLTTMDLSIKNTPFAECQSYVVTKPLALYLDGEVQDPDANLQPGVGCGSQYTETLTYRWVIEGMPATSHAVIGPKPGVKGDLDCPSTPPAGLSNTWTATPHDYPTAACVYTDVGGDQSAPDLYQVRLHVSDGTTEIQSNLFDAPVQNDLPPCLTAAAPQPGAYVVDRNEVQRFDVTGAIDDLDAFGDTLQFQWSIWREQDPTWRTVPQWSLPSYSLDASGFGVGEKIKVRVQGIDRGGVRGGCSNPDDDLCTPSSCLTGTSQLCNAWMTWDLELR
jgi:hypothetical protein